MGGNEARPGSVGQFSKFNKEKLVGMPYKTRNGLWNQAMKASDYMQWRGRAKQHALGDHVLLTEMHTSYT